VTLPEVLSLFCGWAVEDDKGQRIEISAFGSNSHTSVKKPGGNVVAVCKKIMPSEFRIGTGQLLYSSWPVPFQSIRFYFASSGSVLLRKGQFQLHID